MERKGVSCNLFIAGKQEVVVDSAELDINSVDDASAEIQKCKLITRSTINHQDQFLLSMDKNLQIYMEASLTFTKEGETHMVTILSIPKDSDFGVPSYNGLIDRRTGDLTKAMVNHCITFSNVVAGLKK